MEPVLVDCESCGKKVNDRFAACPLCGAQRREKADVRPISLDAKRGEAPPKDTGLFASELPKEARVELMRAQLTGAPVRQPVTGPISAVLSALRPSEATRGWKRTLELVLTVITLPFFLASILWLMIGVKRWGQVSVLDWVTGAIGGGFFLWACFGAALGISGQATLWAVSIMLGAWAARGALRFFSAVERLSDNA